MQTIINLMLGIIKFIGFIVIYIVSYVGTAYTTCNVLKMQDTTSMVLTFWMMSMLTFIYYICVSKSSQKNYHNKKDVFKVILNITLIYFITGLLGYKLLPMDFYESIIVSENVTIMVLFMKICKSDDKEYLFKI